MMPTSPHTRAIWPEAAPQAAAGPASGDLIRDLFAAIDARRFDALGDFFTADAVYERPGYDPICGLPALHHFYREVRLIAAGQHDLTGVVQDTSAAAAWGRFVGQAKNGDALNERFADTYVLRDGKISHRITNFFRPAI
jgi:ketosteroid isomerase-like protein